MNNKTRVAEYIDKHKLIEAIKASMVVVVCEQRTDPGWSVETSKTAMYVIDANKLLEALK